jgi:hypothetical protein
MLGATILNKKVLVNSSAIGLDLTDLSNGLYILEIKQNDKVSIKKFQVNH